METISFIIISYNRPAETVESIRNVMSEIEKVPGYLFDLIVINNGSTVDYKEVEEFIQTEQLQLNYINSPENLGVSRGRNLGIKNAKGKYVVFIDDDAIFKTLDAPKTIVDKFEQYPDTGIIAFGIHNYYTGIEDHPVKDKVLLQQQEFYNNLFWGCGFVVKKEVFDLIGDFDASFFYGMEEYDLAYRTIDAGYKILFTKNVIVLHKVSPKGRETNIVKFSRQFVNKTIIAYRFLPYRFVVSHFIMWSAYFIVKSRCNLFKWVTSCYELFSRMVKEKRTPISKDSLAYLKKVNARLTF